MQETAQARWFRYMAGLFLMLATLTWLPSMPAHGAAVDEGTIPGSYIVTLIAGASPGQVAQEHAQAHGARLDHIYEHALRGYAAHMSEAAAKRVAADPRVRFVVPDRVVTADAQTLPTGIDRVDAEKSTANIDGTDDRVDVDVAVIDTGIDLKHPDLNVVGGKNCSTGKSYADGNGHGTHVAGTIAAKDDGNGVVGVAPGARLWAVRVLDNRGSGSMSSVVCGIDWVTSTRTDANTGNDIEVANMSLGGGGSDDGDCGYTNRDPEHQAICRSVGFGVTYTVAAGNSAVDAATQVPAAYDEVITVSALADFNGKPGGGAEATCRSDVDDTFANFSNYGVDVDLIAPGVCIYSTYKGGGYATLSGTSMASPHVAGTAALYKVNHPFSTPSEVQAALIAAGNFVDWDSLDDRDHVKEPRVNAMVF